MSVFVSHSFENRPEFDNIVDALEAKGVPYWNPAEVKPGSSLREQLREAVESCSVCIFVATRRAIQSSWCGAELGAFWGAGKPVIVYLAEASLSKNELPPVVQGDVWKRRIARVVNRTKELVEEETTRPSDGDPPSSRVGNMTVEQIERVIAGAVAFAAATSKADGRASTPENISRVAGGAAGRMLEGLRSTDRATKTPDDGWRTKILWVDDRPDNNIYERKTFESMGIEFTLALSTEEAIRELSRQRFAAIISDMGRIEGPREGYVLLKKVREKDRHIPFFIYAGSNAPEHKQEADSRGAQGSTNMASALVDMVLSSMPDNDRA